MSGSINYLRYGSWYLEKMKKHPEVYKHFQKGISVVKTNAGYFKAVAADMKLEQSIHRSKNDPGEIIGQAKHQTYVTEWELAYHEVLAISKSYGEIWESVLANTDANLLYKELRNRNIWEYKEAVNKFFLFIKERSNPYESTIPMNLYHFTSGELVDPEISAKILEFFDKGLTEYLIFREKRYLQKSKKLGETIKLFKLPAFIPKSTTEKKGISKVSAKKATKKIGEAQEKIDIARSRGYST